MISRTRRSHNVNKLEIKLIHCAIVIKIYFCFVFKSRCMKTRMKTAVTFTLS